MRVLFVTPNENGSGEAITALRMSERLQAAGHEARFLASRFTGGFLRASLRDRVDELTTDPGSNQRTWQRLLVRFKPTAIVFADYPLLFLSRAGRVLIGGKEGIDIESVDAVLVTLDHLGMAQGPLSLGFGPPHLELAVASLPPLPDRMGVLLPSPMQSPLPVDGRRGTPFQSWPPIPRLSGERRRELRRQFLDHPEGLLVFHSVPTWARAFCERHSLPNYRYTCRLFEHYLTGHDRPVTVLSVNGGSLLSESTSPDLRTVNLAELAPAEYEQLLLASDLMITDNRISVSLGKAVCAEQPCVALRNSFRLATLLERADRSLRRILLEMEAERLGAVFPYEVFPIWSRRDLETLGVFDANPVADSMVLLEIYGGSETRRRLWKAMTDAAFRDALRSRQRRLVELVKRLPSPEEALLSLLA